MDVISRLDRIGLLPRVRLVRPEDAAPLCQALKNGGIPALELDFGAEASEAALKLAREAAPDMLLGAGQVTSCQEADRAMAAGAAFIRCAGTEPGLLRHCIQNGYPVIPSCANPDGVASALNLGLKTVFVSQAMDSLPKLEALAASHPAARFIPANGTQQSLAVYASCPQVAACGVDWVVPEDAAAAQDWGRIEALAFSAVQAMLGLRIAHIGINNADEETTWREARKLSALLGWPIIRDNPLSLFVSTKIEMMKTWYRGTHGHIAVATQNVERARWHLEQRGFSFDDTSIRMTEDGRLKFIYIQEEVAGFAIHLLLE